MYFMVIMSSLIIRYDRSGLGENGTPLQAIILLRTHPLLIDLEED